MGRNDESETRMTAVELRLNEKQKLLTLLYLARRVSATHLLSGLEGCVEMCLLRLEEPKGST